MPILIYRTLQDAALQNRCAMQLDVALISKIVPYTTRRCSVQHGASYNKTVLYTKRASYKKTLLYTKRASYNKTVLFNRACPIQQDDTMYDKTIPCTTRRCSIQTCALYNKTVPSTAGR